MKLSNRLLAAALLFGVAFGAMAQDQDVGVDAGQVIQNTASVAYNVNGVNQTAQTGSDTGFVVDRKIDLTVARTGTTYAGATPGATSTPTDTRTGIAFDVTNLSNDTIDIALVAANYNTKARTSGADEFDVSNFAIYLDVNGDGAFDSGDTLLPTGAGGVYYLDEVPEGRTTKVLVVADIPADLANGLIAGVSLEATAHGSIAATTGAYNPTSGAMGAVIANSTGTDDPAKIDNVFADGQGVLDGATTVLYRNGKHSAADGFVIASAEIVVSKTATVISDPVNDLVNPKAIPGAVVRYCISVANNGSTGANGVVISDELPKGGTPVAYQVTYKPASLYAGGADCTLDANAKVDSDDETTVTATAGNGATGDFGVTAANKVTANLGTLAAGATKTAVFDVTINVP
jgi:uncharacterized repeat protein (TIGR01451 family)